MPGLHASTGHVGRAVTARTRKSSRTRTVDSRHIQHPQNRGIGDVEEVRRQSVTRQRIEPKPSGVVSVRSEESLRETESRAPTQSALGRRSGSPSATRAGGISAKHVFGGGRGGLFGRKFGVSAGRGGD